MLIRRLSFGLALLAFATGGKARADERNGWPVLVQHLDAAGGVAAWHAVGPLFFSKPDTEGGRVGGFRPFYLQRKDAKGAMAEFDVLYPLFFYRNYGTAYDWSVFELINRSGSRDGSPPTARTWSQTFDVWPFYFSKDTGEPASSYHAVFPIFGPIKDRFGMDRIDWTLFPLFLRTQKKGVTTTSTPWPIVRVTRGAAQGFALWPLFGHVARPDAYDRRFYLWPLIWNNTVQAGPDAPPGTAPTHQSGFLPFYAIENRPNSVNETFVWPFFGYTDRSAPDRYHETRYFWPLFVQGNGDQRYVDRWGPFYTHSIIKGMDKTWIVWPAWRRSAWTDGGIAQTKSQFLYFVYWKLEQRSTTNPAAAPATKIHYWPFVSLWDNGAGRRQVQVFSPFEVFFPDNEKIRDGWTPLFALYRHDRDASGGVRGSVLWDAVTWEKKPREDRAEFHVGPLFSVEKRAAGRRVAVGNGLFGWKRGTDGRGWRLFWMEFPPKADTVPSTVR